MISRRLIISNQSISKSIIHRRSFATNNYDHGQYAHASSISLIAHRLRTDTAFMWRVVGGALAAVAVAAYAYQRRFEEAVPISGRRRVLNFPHQLEQFMGRAAFDQLRLKNAKSELPKDSPMTLRAQRVLDQLLRASPQLARDAADNWRLIVVQTNEVNAFALPGGRVVVNTGLLNFCGTDDELAVVIGHEIAHVVARHGAEKMSGVMVGKLVRLAVGGFTNSDALWSIFFSVSSDLPMSRLMESEADHIGLMLLARAGYCPHWAPALWERMAALSKAKGKQPSRWLSTHPPSSERAIELERRLRDAMPIYHETQQKLVWWERFVDFLFPACPRCQREGQKIN
jgi:predicted Zn-dependent protease